MLYRVAMGEPLRRVLGSDAAFPCLSVLARWRRQNREFDSELRIAMKGSRFRRGARRLWSQDLQTEITMRIAEGSSFRDIPRDPDMPALSTLSNWMRRKPGFVDAVAAAYRRREQMILDRQLEIARAATEASVGEARRQIAALERRRAILRTRAPDGDGGWTYDLGACDTALGWRGGESSQPSVPRAA